VEVWIQIVVPLALLVLGYGFGHIQESKHYDSIRRREKRLAGLVAVPARAIPGMEGASRVTLVQGAVVVSVDYFKRFAAGLRNIFGGRVRAYESLVDRGRREAILRMKEQAEELGCNAVVRLRIETSRLASSRADGKGTAGIEVLAYGTALRLPDRDE
jgi:uncharacterized protein YbjQ (UPF0145 family)